MRLTQGQFSFLPDLTDAEIQAQVQYALDQGWAVAVEFTDDPHPRNAYWEMWGTPLFDLRDAVGVMQEITACRQVHAGRYVKVLAFDSTRGFETVRMSFLVGRPAEEPGFELVRSQGPGQQIQYTLRSYATGSPAGARYAAPPPAAGGGA